MDDESKKDEAGQESPAPAVTKENVFAKLLAAFLVNHHASGSSIICLACGLGEIWIPRYKEQFIMTRNLATTYLVGAVMVANRKDNERK